MDSSFPLIETTSARCSYHLTIDEYSEAIVIRCPSCSYTNFFRFTMAWAPTWKSRSCTNCHLHSFQNFVGPIVGRYKRLYICWACDHKISTMSAHGNDRYKCKCGKRVDGTEEIKWVYVGGGLGGKGREGEVVDWDEERKRWGEWDKRVGHKERVCEQCGKVCKNRSGLMTHLRSCKGGKKEKYIMKRIRVETKPYVDV